MDVHTIEQRSKNMRAIKSSGTLPERLLSRALWNKGIRFRKNVKSVFGNPDIAFKKYRIAVFVDSEFFHGKNWQIEREKIRSEEKRKFWWTKIERNMLRDTVVNQKLSDANWIVLRFWTRDVKKNIDHCVNQIISAINTRRIK